jgi:hypothetical protein
MAAPCTHITYEFEELALLSDGKYGGMFVNGRATIAGFDDDEWYVRTIEIDGIEVEKDVMPWLWHKVAAELESQCADSILEQIRIEDVGIAQRMRAVDRGYDRSAA